LQHVSVLGVILASQNWQLYAVKSTLDIGAARGKRESGVRTSASPTRRFDWPTQPNRIYSNETNKRRNLRVWWLLVRECHKRYEPCASRLALALEGLPVATSCVPRPQFASRAMVIVPKAHSNARALVSATHHPAILKNIAFLRAQGLHGKAAEQGGDALTVEMKGLSMDLVSPRGPKDLFAEDLFENWMVRT
jgi:hypothetical protein